MISRIAIPWGAMIIKKNSILDRIAKWKGAIIIKGGVR
jgi:hypothetical protein